MNLLPAPVTACCLARKHVVQLAQQLTRSDCLRQERSGDWGQKPPQGGFSVEMMGFLGMGNNPMVGATVAVAVAVAESKK